MTIKTGYVKRCYETHPPLPIKAGDKEYLIYGGSCGYPIVEDADIYVGFDYSMKKSPMAYPWEEGESFQYLIQDMHAPSDPVSFKHLISWLADQLVAGKKVHLGCIGGHGRTGLVLAALVTFMTGEKDSITYVRKNYCVKAVESASQVRFLHQHFGIVEVVGHKDQGNVFDFDAKGTDTGRWSGAKSNHAAKPISKRNEDPLPMDKRENPPSWKGNIIPTNHPMAVWSAAVTIDKSVNSGIITV